MTRPADHRWNLQPQTDRVVIVSHFGCFWGFGSSVPVLRFSSPPMLIIHSSHSRLYYLSKEYQFQLQFMRHRLQQYGVSFQHAKLTLRTNFCSQAALFWVAYSLLMFSRRSSMHFPSWPSQSASIAGTALDEVRLKRRIETKACSRMSAKAT